jgi:hypothetical protein
MAMVNNSDDEHMADDEFNDFTISKDNIFFSEEKKRRNLKTYQPSQEATQDSQAFQTHVFI